jgi:integrase
MAKKIRGRNEGSLFQRPNGRWRAQVFIQGRRLSKDLKTKAEGLNWLRMTRTGLDQGLNFDGANSSLLEFLESWLVTIASSIRPMTLKQYRKICRNHIVPLLGKIRLVDLRPEHIQRLYQAKIQAGVGLRTVELIHVTIH